VSRSQPVFQISELIIKNSHKSLSEVSFSPRNIYGAKIFCFERYFTTSAENKKMFFSANFIQRNLNDKLIEQGRKVESVSFDVPRFVYGIQPYE
jgi:hypothetical protein